METLDQIQAKRDSIARDMLHFFREACAVGISPKRAAELARRGWAHKLPRTDAESLRRRVARLMRYSRSPIPNHLPCGQDDHASEMRGAAGQEARHLAQFIKAAR
jgi:hypothetical protein